MVHALYTQCKITAIKETKQKGQTSREYGMENGKMERKDCHMKLKKKETTEKAKVLRIVVKRKERMKEGI